MNNPLTALLTFGRKILSPNPNKSNKNARRLSIEKKWWMGEDLFIDQKPFTANALKNKHITG